MLEQNNADFGNIQIHKEAIADIVAAAIKDVEGAGLVPKGPWDGLLEFFGKKRYSGIKIEIDKDHQVTIHLKVLVRYGINIFMIGRQLQEAVQMAVEKLTNVDLKDINVNICGMERGNP